MTLGRWIAGVACVALSRGAIAQGTSAQGATAQPASVTTDSIGYARAQALVSSGNGAAGRAVVDSILARTPTSSPRYAEGLYWRATLAASAVDAERDYRRVAVEYPLSPRVPAALTRLAQLEMARGDRALARQHLERLLAEYPPAQQRADAWYWLGRIAFESGDAARGCAAIDSARASAPTDDIELTNRIASEGRRCASLPAGIAAAPMPTPAPAPSRPAPSTVRPNGASASASAAGRGASEYTVQVGAYPSRATADKVRRQLAAQGYAARVVPRGKLFGVRVGRFTTRAAAARTATKLKAARHDAMVVDAEPR